MDIVSLRLDELTPYENNPRQNDAAVDAVAASIKQFGFKVPIVVDANNVIVAGHTRFKAATKLGLDTVPCVVADDLTEEQVKAFRLADNKVGELAEWAQIALNEKGEVMYCCHKPYQIVGHILDPDILEKKNRATTDMSGCDIPCRMTGPNAAVRELMTERKDACFI